MCFVCESVRAAEGRMWSAGRNGPHEAGMEAAFAVVGVDAGVADTGAGPRVSAFELSTGKWGPSGSFGTTGGVVTWSMAGAGLTNASFFTDFFTGQTVNMASTLGFDPVPVIRNAFAAWSQIANISFAQIEDGGGNIGVGMSADIRIAMAYLDGDNRTLGKAYYPSPGGTPNADAADGDIVVDSSEVNYWTATTLYLVVLHEIGHALGLEHSTLSSAVMAPSINTSLFNTGPFGTSLQQDDIDGARAIYGNQDTAIEAWQLPSGQANVTFLNTGPLRILGNGLANQITGAGGAETILGGLGADTLRGGDGADALFGDFEPAGPSGIQLGSGTYAKPANQANGTPATAVNISGLFSLAANANIIDSTSIPHVSITGAGRSGVAQTDHYRLTIANPGAVITLDVDATTLGLDSYVRILSAAGAVLAQNDDSSPSDGAGGSSRTQDSFLVFVAPTAGDYIIEIGAYGGTPIAALPANAGYTLHVSVAGEIDAAGGNDVLRGEAGNDLLRGGAGTDSLFGGSGIDTLFGDAGNDTLFGEQDNDLIFGWTGADLIWGGAGFDTLRGEQDNDVLLGEAGEDVLWGGDGNDLIYGWEWNDTLFGEAGNDTLFGEQDNDVLYGWLGGDVMWGGNGNDVLWGEQDNDTLLGETGNDLLFGQDGDDVIYGWAGADSLYGWSGNDVLFGEQDNDLLLGEDGNDVLVGGRGRDTLSGGAGADRFFNAGFEMAAGEVDLIREHDAADIYLFQTGSQLRYVPFSVPGYGTGAAIHVTVQGGVFVLDVIGATTAQLQAQTQFF